MSERRRYSERDTGGYDDSQNYGASRPSRFEERTARYGGGGGNGGAGNAGNVGNVGGGGGQNPSRSPSPPPHHVTRKGNSHGDRKRSNSESQRGFHDTRGRGGGHRGRGGSRGGGGRHFDRSRDYKQSHHHEPRNLGGFSYSPPKNEEKEGYESDQKNSYRRKYSNHHEHKSPKDEEEHVGFTDSKMRGGDRVPEKLDPEKRETFHFRVFIKDEYLKEGLASKSEIEEIIRLTQIDDIRMDSSIKVPDMPGQAMIIISNDLQKREDALREVLSQIERIEQDFDRKKYNNGKPEIELMTFVPEGLVAVTIGHKGRLIQKIKEDTGISVVINQRVRGMSHRSTHAKGNSRQLAKACAIMYDTLESQAYLIKDWDKIKTESISREDCKLNAKFIVDTDACGFIIGKHGNFTKYLENNLGIYMRCDKDDNNRILRSYQSICAMKGTLKDIQKGIKELCKRLEEYYKTSNNDFSRYPFNVVIPANYVTKIIGAGGCMVKNIAQHANGAQIKINSDKDSKKNLREVSVAINGTIEGKYRAAHLIIEQVEIFKLGGPIIQSGKVLNQNLAAQIQNSGLFKDGAYRPGDRDNDDRDAYQPGSDRDRDNRNDDRRDRRRNISEEYNKKDERISRRRKQFSRSKSPSQDSYHQRESKKEQVRSFSSNKYLDNENQNKRHRKSSRSRSRDRKQSHREKTQWDIKRSSSRDKRDRRQDETRDRREFRDNTNNNVQEIQQEQEEVQQMEIQEIQTGRNIIKNDQQSQSNMEIEENSVQDFNNNIQEEKIQENPELPGIEGNEDYTSPENLTEDIISTEFKHLSRYSEETNGHVISLGIKLSLNHPVLQNTKFLQELKDKIKGIEIKAHLTEAIIKVDGSMEQHVKVIKQLASQIINVENSKENGQNV